MTNLSTIMPTLSMYEKTPKQQTLTTLPNSCSPTNASTFQLGFSQAQAFNQATLPQSRAFYKDSDAMDFAFPNQAGVSKTQPQSQMNSYNMFCNYEPTEHFNLWKDNRSSQPSTPWWSSAGNAAGQIHASNSTVNDGAFSNWCDSINIGNMAGNRMMLTPGKSYQQQQHNEQHGRPGLGNAFENSRLFELEQKTSSQPVSTGNTYSLFSGNTWSTVNTPVNSNSTNQDEMKARVHQQSLWSGPGPSPLERLLEQQKSLREGGTT